MGEWLHISLSSYNPRSIILIAPQALTFTVVPPGRRGPSTTASRRSPSSPKLNAQGKGEIKSNSPVEPRFKKPPQGISIMTSTKVTSLCIATEFMETDGTSVFFEAINYQSLHRYKKGNVLLLRRNPSYREQTVLFSLSVLRQLNF